MGAQCAPSFIAAKFSKSRKTDRPINTEVKNLSAIRAIALSISSGLLMTLAYPDFNYPLLAWISFVPLLIGIARAANARLALLLGWLWGAVFFYGSCFWISYSIIHYGQLPPLVGYALVLIPVLISALF